MKAALFCAVLFCCLVLPNCRKEKFVTFYGQLLLTKKHPVPVANRQVKIYQQGTPTAIGINIGSTSSSISGTTDANGFFRLKFTPGKASFIIFSSESSAPLTLSSDWGDTSLPSFSRQNFRTTYQPGAPMYIGKTIDTVIIKMSLINNLTGTDTVGLQCYTLNGRISKEYTGRSGAAGSVIILDTINNMLFTSFDCSDQQFINDINAGKKWTTNLGYNFISSAGVISPSRLAENDETKKEFTFYFKN